MDVVNALTGVATEPPARVEIRYCWAKAVDAAQSVNVSVEAQIAFRRLN